MKAALGLAVAFESLGRKPFLGGDRIVGRALHAFAHLEKVAITSLSISGSHGRMQQAGRPPA